MICKVSNSKIVSPQGDGAGLLESHQQPSRGAPLKPDKEGRAPIREDMVMRRAAVSPGLEALEELERRALGGVSMSESKLTCGTYLGKMISRRRLSNALRTKKRSLFFLDWGELRRFKNNVEASNLLVSTTQSHLFLMTSLGN